MAAHKLLVVVIKGREWYMLYMYDIQSCIYSQIVSTFGNKINAGGDRDVT